RVPMRRDRRVEVVNVDIDLESRAVVADFEPQLLARPVDADDAQLRLAAPQTDIPRLAFGRRARRLFEAQAQVKLLRCEHRGGIEDRECATSHNRSLGVRPKSIGTWPNGGRTRINRLA